MPGYSCKFLFLVASLATAAFRIIVVGVWVLAEPKVHTYEMVLCTYFLLGSLLCMELPSFFFFFLSLSLLILWGFLLCSSSSMSCFRIAMGIIIIALLEDGKS